MRLFKVVNVSFALLLAAMALCCALAAPAGAAQPKKCTIVGTPGPDVLHGTPGADVICGRGGNDVLVGLGGNDILIGGAGNDKLEGGAGDDLLIGGGGADRLDGGAGKNLLRGGGGANYCSDGTARGCAKGPAAEHGKHRIKAPRRFQAPAVGCAPNCTAPTPTAPQPDTEPPVFSYLRVDRSLDLTHGSGQIGIDVDAWDTRGEVASVTVNVAAPDGSPWRSVSLSKLYQLGWHASLPIPAGSPLGVYSVESVEVVDTAGNSTLVDHARLEAEFDEDEFSVYEGPDTEPPTLESFSITPTVTGTGAGPVDVGLVGQVSDQQSGVKLFRVTVTLPTHPWPWEFGIGIGGRQITGTQVAGTDESVFELAQWAYPGVYRVTAIELEDFEGNEVKIEGPELEALGFPTEFEATAPGDTTPPEIVGVSVATPTIPAAGGTVITYVHVHDDLSGFGTWPNQGFSEVYLSYDWPPHSGRTETTGRVEELVSGDSLDGTWKIETTFAADAPAGQYPLEYVGAYDRAENGGPMDRAELEARGWDAGFTKLP
ncbi:MAG TPA: hypothetical protein VN671_13385 [Solirubrobacterales bacterium]|nr:hypothetical protein [Solirubrobacterales bacterium]